MKKLRKYKSLIAAIVIFILVFVLFLLLYRTFFPDEQTAIYGDRLKGIEKVELTDSNKDKIEKALSDVSKETTVRTQGRIINVSMSIKDEVNRDGAKAAAAKVLENLSKDQKEYYDIQVFISKSGKTEDAGQFPIIGYKHHVSEGYTWTKDR